MQTVTKIGEKLVLSYTHDLYGKYDIEKVNGPYYKFISDEKVVFFPESEILNGTIGIQPIPAGRKNRRATRKARRNR
jgi:hypothetical protein